MPRPALLATVVATLAGPVSAQDSVPIGDVYKFTFDQSKVFPGTVRDYWVYVPKQYDGKTPACVHVNQDGVQFQACFPPRTGHTPDKPGALDRLIHAKKIPPLIGVFVVHGRVPAPNPAAEQDRWNRSYEYDGLGDNYVRFLLEELLPEVETKTTADGRKIVLSKSGNDRSIGGTSSGAIAAFTAAWERPDAFTRVFSGIGTYVGIRSGERYSTLVRKVEPKPLRIFMEDGSNDLNIYAGDWWMANQSLQRSLKFAGYEHKFTWGDGPHNNNHATKLFPEGMEFLWAGWPEPVKAGRGSGDMQSVLVQGEPWKLVGEGYTFTEGPAVNARGEVVFCDVPKSKVYKLGPDGKPVEFIADSQRASGAAFGPDGKLYTSGSNKVIVYDADGKNPKVLADGIGGNDLVVLSNGNVYVTDPGNRKVWLVKPTGEKLTVDTGLGFANGVTCTPDQRFLHVADSRSHWVYSYLINADGTLSAKQKYHHLHVPDTADDSGADGLRCDRTGQLFVATRMGVQFCDQPGRVHGIIPTPNGKCANLCFGGPKFDTLYATCGDKVYSRKVKVTGAAAVRPPNKPPRPGL
ncbi:MAG: SMP-30/gluconolactonase/LRE family protein [Gemmataceae bacterium]